MEILQQIEHDYPGWIQHTLDGYADEYAHFQQNWKLMCDMLKCKPEQILLVSEIEPYESEDQEKSFIQKGCDVLTQKGFCVRRVTEFQPCRENCGVAIPTLALHQKLHAHPMIQNRIPAVWKDTCDSCS